MKTADLTRYVGIAATFAVIAGCSPLRQGQGDIAPATTAFNIAYVGRTLSVNGRLVTAARPPAVQPRFATLLPDLHGKHHWEYIINNYGSYASVFNYPVSDKQVWRINDVGGQGCTNVLYGYGKKIIWIVAADNQIEEFQVPKKPIKTLADSIGMPSSCAMNTAGDLAVGILFGPDGGSMVIFKHAAAPGITIGTPLGEEYFDGYDDKGDLFADGFTNTGNFALVELPKGQNKFRTISTSNTVDFPGSVQWDGTYITVFDQIANATYRYKVSGNVATLKGTVQLSGSSDCAQTWIVGHLLFCADAGNDDGEVFKYPLGGSPIAIFSGNFDFPLGVTVSNK